MPLCTQSPYTLPTISFVGGETQNLSFRTYMYNSKKPFNLTGCSCNFSVVWFGNKNGTTVISKPMEIVTDESAPEKNIAKVILDAKDTVNLSGKFIYQISILDADGNAEIPNQGILLITKNINGNFLSV